jgi:tetratricopeptide (TPR) repeat protein
MNFERLRLYLKILLPFFVGIGFGITALPHAYSQALQKAVFTEQQSSYLESGEALATAAQFFPWRGDLWEQAGAAALKGNESDKAIVFFERALGMNKLSPEGMLQLGEAFEQNNDLIQAINTWNKALGNPAIDQQLHEHLVSAFLQLNNYPKALEHLNSLAKLQPKEAKYVYQIGLIQSVLDPEAALSNLALAGELDPAYLQRVSSLLESIQMGLTTGDPAYALVSAGRGLAILCEWKLAKEAFSRAIEIQPAFAEGWAYRGEARQQLGEDGLSDVEKALTLNPRSIVANTLMGLYWQRQNNFEKAVSYFETSARIDPANPALQAEIGNSIAQLGDINLALSYFQRAVELSPNDPVYLRKLAEFCVHHEIQVQEIGLPAALKVVTFSPDEAASQDILAQVYILLEEQDLALACLQKALTLDPNFAPAYLHLGFIDILQGNFSSAEDALNTAINLSLPDDPVKEQARRLLENLNP